MGKWYQNRILGAVVVLFAAVCYLPGIGSVSLFDRDEPRFAEAAREMIVRGDYVVPYFNEEPRLHKPPLVYWVMVGAYKLFGVNEFGARAGSAVAGILTCLLVYLLASEMFGPSVGLLAGVMMASNVLTLVIARAATADSLQLLTLMLCFLGFWRIYRGERRFSSYALLYGGLALGGLAKGPVVVSVFLVAAIGTVVLDRRTGLFGELKLIPGLLAAGAVVGLWLIPANMATKGEFIRVGLGHHVLGRAFAESMEGHSGPFFYYLALLPITFSPWFAVLPLAAGRFWSSPDARPARSFLLSWAVAPFIIFSFLKTKLPHYVLPAYPALAIITAFGLETMIRKGESIWDHWLGKAGIGLLVAFALLSIAALAVFPFYADLHNLEKSFLGVVLLLTAILWFCLSDLSRGKTQLFAVDLAVGMALLAAVLGLVYLPAMDRDSAARKLSRQLDKVVREGDEILSLGYREPTLVFYAKRPVHFVSNWEQVTEHLSADQGFVCIASEKKMERLPPELGKALDKVGQTSAFLPSKGKWMTWTLLAHRSNAIAAARQKAQ